MDTITIIGTGLIGTSLGLAIKKVGIKNVQIVGTDLERYRANKAKSMKAVDRVENNMTAAVRDASMVFIATPVMAIKEVMEHIGPQLRRSDERTIVSDTGGTKAAVLEWAKEYLPDHVDFVGGHPLAGRETPGPDNADGDLFNDRPYCIVPSPGASQKGVTTIVDLTSAMGASPFFIDAQEHDSFVAAVSHLPFVLSAALIGATSKSPQWGDISHLASSGFRDVSRLASGDSAMHRDVCLTNQDGIIHWINEFIMELERIKGIMRQEEASQPLYDLFETAFEEREKWLGGVVTPWARADYERPKPLSFGRTAATLMFGSRATTGLLGEDEDDKKKRR